MAFLAASTAGIKSFAKTRAPKIDWKPSRNEVSWNLIFFIVFSCGINPLFYCTIKYGVKDRKDERLESSDEGKCGMI